MARFTAISRCAGQNHVHFTIQRTAGGIINRTQLINELTGPPPNTEAYLDERVSLLVREAQAAGNTTFAQIQAYLLNLGEWVE